MNEIAQLMQQLDVIAIVIMAVMIPNLIGGNSYQLRWVSLALYTAGVFILAIELSHGKWHYVF